PGELQSTGLTPGTAHDRPHRPHPGAAVLLAGPGPCALAGTDGPGYDPGRAQGSFRGAVTPCAPPPTANCTSPPTARHPCAAGTVPSATCAAPSSSRPGRRGASPGPAAGRWAPTAAGPDCSSVTSWPAPSGTSQRRRSSGGAPQPSRCGTGGGRWA